MCKSWAPAINLLYTVLSGLCMCVPWSARKLLLLNNTTRPNKRPNHRWKSHLVNKEPLANRYSWTYDKVEWLPHVADWLAHWTRLFLAERIEQSVETASTENITRPSAILDRFSDLDWNRRHETSFTSPFLKVSVFTCPQKKISVCLGMRFQKTPVLKPFSKVFVFISVFEHFSADASKRGRSLRKVNIASHSASKLCK